MWKWINEKITGGGWVFEYPPIGIFVDYFHFIHSFSPSVKNNEIQAICLSFYLASLKLRKLEKICSTFEFFQIHTST